MRKGFTLAELLVCVAIIGLLAAVILPVLAAVRGKKPYNHQTDQDRLQEAYSKVAPAENPVRYSAGDPAWPENSKPSKKDTRFEFEAQGRTPDDKPAYLVTDKVTGKQYIVIGDGSVELK